MQNAVVKRPLDDLLAGNMPKKRFFRSRAHCNPLSNNDGFRYPVKPSLDVWRPLYPNISDEELIIRHLDIGMGFGGLTVALARIFPDKLTLGMEIRAKVSRPFTRTSPFTLTLRSRCVSMFG